MMGNTSEFDKKNLGFHLFFLWEDVERGVEVREVWDMYLQEVEKRLEQRKAILIAPESMRNIEANHISYRGMRDLSKKHAKAGGTLRMNDQARAIFITERQ
jgi:hypothetical protein